MNNMLCNFFLKNKIENNKSVYLDYAAGTTSLRDGEANELLFSSEDYNNFIIGGNPSSIHSEGIKSKKLLNKARRAIAKVLNCHDYEVYFMPNSTFSIATAFNILKRKNDTLDTPQDTIITSNIEHPAVLANARKYKHIVLKVEENGILAANTLREALSSLTLTPNPSPSFGEGDHPKASAFLPSPNLGEGARRADEGRGLVSIMYANNEIGTIQKSKEYGRIIDEYNRKHNLDAESRVLYHIDASQASNYLDLDIRKLRCDMLTLNSSKCYGPRGIALLYVKEDIRPYLKPLYEGGDQESGLYSGTENVIGAMRFAEALTYVQSIKEEEGLRLCALRDDFIQKYKNEMWDRRSCQGAYATLTPNPSPSFGEGDHSGTQNNSCSSCVCEERLVYGSTEVDERLPNNINIRIPGVPSDEAVIRLDQKGFAVSHRSACATVGRTSHEEVRRMVNNDTDHIDLDSGYVLTAIGATDEETSENIRISMGLYTTEDDMDRLLDAILEIYEKYSGDYK